LIDSLELSALVMPQSATPEVAELLCKFVSNDDEARVFV